jgi:hypothetical protein
VPGKLLSLLLAVATLSSSAALTEESTMAGWVTDAKCAARQGADFSNSDCAKKCVQNGEKLVFVGSKDKKVYQVENQDSLKGHEGQHVRVTGREDNGTLHISKVVRIRHTESK